VLPLVVQQVQAHLGGVKQPVAPVDDGVHHIRQARRGGRRADAADKRYEVVCAHTLPGRQRLHAQLVQNQTGKVSHGHQQRAILGRKDPRSCKSTGSSEGIIRRVKWCS